MICFAEEKDREDIKAIWQEAFGDSESDIDRYLDRYLKNVLVYKEKIVLGMLSLLPLKMGEKKGRYIYAVATKKECRGVGISTKLLDYAKSYIGEINEEFLVLVPAEKSLFDFYQKRGFIPISTVRKECYENCKSTYSDIGLIGISAEEFSKYRKEYFRNYEFIEWDLPELNYISDLYGGNIFKMQKGVCHAFAICSWYNGMLDIKELCTSGIRLDECVGKICSYFETDRCLIATPDKNAEAYAMIYPDKYNNQYFNIAID